jgi:dienelactone hydrolase
MTVPQFALQPHSDALYDDCMRRSIPRERDSLRDAFRNILGLAGRSLPPLSAEVIHAIDRPEHTEEKIRLSAGEDVSIPVFVLAPKTRPPFKPVLVFPGHEPGIRYCIGNFPDPETAQIHRTANDNFAEYLAGCGYLVGAVEQRGMGERLAGQAAGGGQKRSCRELSFAYLMMGRTLMGERCWDGMCAASYLLSRPDVTPGGLGATGHSGGGATALWLAALDERIRTAVVSGYFCSFRDSIMSIAHCECNYIPGILNLSEMGGLAALIAPRPLCIIHGRQDPIFPYSGTAREFETVRQAYGRSGVPDACRLAVHPGGHEYRNGPSREWLDRWM